GKFEFMSHILNQYEITFNNILSNGYNNKMATTSLLTSGVICNMLNVIYTFMECEDIIYMIEYAQSHTGYSDFPSIDGLSLEINSTEAIINDSDNFPLSDIKEIVEEWSKFLETPPLHMEKVNQTLV
ncbi:MAG: hypothetical protein ACXWDO_09725, partial [Bacteroidia bacterium]